MIKTPVWQVMGALYWVKEIMILELVEPGSHVAELWACGCRDASKWQRAHIGQWYGVGPDADKAAAAHAEAVAPGSSSTAPMKAVPCTLTAPLSEAAVAAVRTPEGDQVDRVVCWHGLGAAFASAATLTAFWCNVNRMLRPGAYFFGVSLDAAKLWSMAQSGAPADEEEEAPLGHVSGSLFNLRFDVPAAHIPELGASFTLNMKGDPSPTSDAYDADFMLSCKAYLPHGPSLIRVGKKCGFRMVEMTPLADFFDQRQHNYAAELRHRAFPGAKKEDARFQSAQWEVFGLYRTMVFRKERDLTPEEVEELMTAAVADDDARVKGSHASDGGGDSDGGGEDDNGEVDDIDDAKEDDDRDVDDNDDDNDTE